MNTCSCRWRWLLGCPVPLVGEPLVRVPKTVLSRTNRSLQRTRAQFSEVLAPLRDLVGVFGRCLCCWMLRNTVFSLDSWPATSAKMAVAESSRIVPGGPHAIGVVGDRDVAGVRAG